jgi:hypothetical protein
MSQSQLKALAPGNFSAKGRAIFGSAVAKILAGRHVRWLSSISCNRLANPPAPDYMVLAPGTGSNEFQTTYNWSGYQTLPVGETYSPGTNYIANAAAQFQVPPVNPGTELNAVSASWVGIGQDTAGSRLVQAGVQAQYLDGQSELFPWIEVVPGQPEQPKSLQVSAGDILSVDVGYDPNISGGEAGFIVCNLTTNLCVMPSATESGVGLSGDTAEWIVERPAFPTDIPNVVEFFPMNDFGEETFAYPQFIQTGPSGIQRYFLSQSTDYNQFEAESCYPPPPDTPEVIAQATPNQVLSFNDVFDNLGFLDFYNEATQQCDYAL